MIFSFKSVSVVSAEASGAFRDDEEKSVLFCFLNPPGSGNGSREDSLFSGCSCLAQEPGSGWNGERIFLQGEMKLLPDETDGLEKDCNICVLTEFER